jgi:hypothetical protein
MNKMKGISMKFFVSFMLLLSTFCFGKFTVAFWGDCRENQGKAFENICGYLIREQGKAVDVHWQNGDFSEGGYPDDFTASFAIKNAKEACIKDYFFMCTSNHDSYGTNKGGYPVSPYQTAFKDILPNTNGQNCFYFHKAWNIPGSTRRVHLLAYDSYFSNRYTQADYFSAYLNNVDPNDWICVLLHPPVYAPMTYKPDDRYKIRRDVLTPILQAGGDFVLNGHAHSYRRTHVLDIDGNVAEQTNGPGSEHISPDNSLGLVHIVNGRGGVFRNDTDGVGWEGNAFAPPLVDQVGIITLMEFQDSSCRIRTVQIDSNYQEAGVIDEWTWTRASAGTTGLAGRKQRTVPELLLSAFPNPVKGNIQVRTQRLARIFIYDLKGRCVKEFPPNRHIIWSGKDRQGKVLSSGNYLIRAVFSNQQAEKMVTLIR